MVDVNLAPLHARLIPRRKTVLFSLLDAMFVDFQQLLSTVPERLADGGDIRAKRMVVRALW